MMSRKMSRREVLVGLTLAIVGAGALQACSSSTPPAATAAPSGSSNAAPTSAPAANGTAAPAAAASSQAAVKTTLRFTDWWGQQFPHYIPLMQKKTGIAISEEQVPYSNFEQKLLTQFVAGTAPDFFLVDTYWNGDMFPSGNLLPFDDYLKSRKDVDMSKWNVDPGKENGYQGKTMGLSIFTAQDLIVHVNQELADQAGLLKDLPAWGADSFDTWHWDKLADWLKAGTKTKSDGTVEQYGLGTDVSGFTELLKVLTYQNGGKEFDDGVWNYGETQLLLDQPEAIEAIQFAADLVLKYKVAPTPGAEKAINGGTYRAKRAMAAINWSTPSAFPEENTFKQTWFQLPFSKSKTHRFGANYFSVNSKSKQTDAALEWTTTFCVDNDVRAAFLQVSSVPAYDPLPIVKASPDSSGKTIALINLARIKGMSPLPADAEGVVVYPGWDGRTPQFTDNTIKTAMQSVVVSGVSVKDAFSKAKQTIDAELAKKK